MAIVDGWVETGFQPVADAFSRNFREHGEVGAAFAVYRDREIVVDLWGGLSDRAARRRWQADTTQAIFSGTKGLVAVCLLLWVQRGLVDLDAPVCSYWPEFGKPNILVKDIASHVARLPGIDTPVSLEAFLDDRQMARLVADQDQSPDPRAAFCYHPMTYGWVLGELGRRVDGRSVAAFFADEVAAPLNLDLWIGLPAGQEARVATLEVAPSWPASAYLDPAQVARDRFVWSIWGNPPVLGREHFPWNRGDYHAAVIPGAGAIGTARSVAKMYANLDSLLRSDVLDLARQTCSAGRDEILGEPLRFGVGFQLTTELETLGPVPDAFGHPGAGGSVHGCWPTERVGFSYSTNMLSDDEVGDSRAARLLQALHGVCRSCDTAS